MAVSTAAIISSGTSAPQSPHTSAAILEYLCLFTHDLKRKQKRWQDGRLKFHTFNKRVMVYDERGYQMGDTHWRNDYDFGEGEEVRLERGGVIVQVSECVGRQEQDLSELVDKRVQEKEQRSRNAASRTPVLQLRPEARLPQAVRPRVGHRPLHHVIGTPTGHHGRASVPKESPFEERQRQNQAEAEPESRPSKRTRYDNSPPSKSGYAQSLFGARLTLSSQPASSLPPRNPVDRTASVMDGNESTRDRPGGQDGGMEETQPRSPPHFPADKAGYGRPWSSKSRSSTTTLSSAPRGGSIARQLTRPVDSLARDDGSGLMGPGLSHGNEPVPDAISLPRLQPAEESQRKRPAKPSPRPKPKPKPKPKANAPQPPPPQDVIDLDAEPSPPAIQPAPGSEAGNGQGQQKSGVSPNGRDGSLARRKSKQTVPVIEISSLEDETIESGPTTRDDWEKEAEEIRKQERTTEIRLKSRGRRGLLMTSKKTAPRQHQTVENTMVRRLGNENDSPKELEEPSTFSPPRRQNARQKTTGLGRSRTGATVDRDSVDRDAESLVLQDIPQNSPRPLPKQKQKKRVRAPVFSDDDEARDAAAGLDEQGSHAPDDDDSSERPARKTRKTDQRKKTRQNRRRDESDADSRRAPGIDDVAEIGPMVPVKPRLARLARKGIRSMEIIGLQFDDEGGSGLTFGPGHMPSLRPFVPTLDNAEKPASAATQITSTERPEGQPGATVGPSPVLGNGNPFSSALDQREASPAPGAQREAQPDVVRWQPRLEQNSGHEEQARARSSEQVDGEESSQQRPADDTALPRSSERDASGRAALAVSAGQSSTETIEALRGGGVLARTRREDTRTSAPTGPKTYEPCEVTISNEDPQPPHPAAGSTRRPPRIANPATRGRKAALKSHAAGQVPQSILPPAEPLAQPRARADDELLVPRPPSIEVAAQPPPPPAAAAAGGAGGGGEAGHWEQAPAKRKMKFPGFGFLSATTEGPWSREAHDLLGRGRPSA